MSNEKKKSIIFVSILSLLALVLTGLLIVDKLTERGVITSSDSQKIVKKFDKYYNSKEKTVIYYASTTCGWCSLQTPILETIAEDYEMDYLYVDNSKLAKNQREEIASKLGIETSTPTTVIVQNGEVIDVAEGFTPAKEYIKFFSKNGLIPEDAVYSKENNLNFISYDEYERLTNEEGTNIIVIGQTTCSHCIAVKPTLNSIAADYKLTINYIDINEVSEEEMTKFYESLTRMEYSEPEYVEEGKFGTPLTLIVKNGKISSYVAGERSKSQFVREFKKAGLITE